MMAERGIVVDHSTLHRWVIRLVPLLDKAFRLHKRTVGRRWRMDETYIKIKGQWKYLYRAVGTAGQTVDFLLTTKRDAPRPRCASFAKPFVIMANPRWSLSIKVAPTRRRCPRSMLTNQKKTASLSGRANTWTTGLSRTLVISNTE